MATIGTIAVNAIANIAPFQAGMKQMQQTLGGFNATAKSSIASIPDSAEGAGSSLSGLASKSIVAAVSFAAVKKAADMAHDALQWLADLGGDAKQLEDLAIAAERLGISMSTSDLATLSEYSAGWQDLVDTLKVLWAELGVLVAPVLIAIGRGLREVIKIAIDLSNQLQRAFGFKQDGEAAAKLAADRAAKERETAKAIAAKNLAMAESKRIADEIKKAEQERGREAEEFARRGEDLMRRVRTPQEIYNETIHEAAELLRRNVVGIETYRRAVAGARGDLEAATKSAERFKEATKREEVGADLFGSGGAFGAIAAASNARLAIPETKAAERTAEATERTNDLLVSFIDNAGTRQEFTIKEVTIP